MVAEILSPGIFCRTSQQSPNGILVTECHRQRCTRHGITILPIDMNLSAAICTIENNKLRLGLNYVDGIGETVRDRILQKRDDRSFTSLQNFCQRTRIPERLVENLIKAGAFDFCGMSRRNLFWELGRFELLPK